MDKLIADGIGVALQLLAALREAWTAQGKAPDEFDALVDHERRNREQIALAQQEAELAILERSQR